MVAIKLVKIKRIFLSFIFVFITNVNAASQGEKLYQLNCMVCHGDDGSGAMSGVKDLAENRGWSTIDG